MMRRNRKWMMAVAILCGGSMAQAGVVTTTTPFTGTTVTTDLMTVGDQALPWTDANSRTLNGSSVTILNGYGLVDNAAWPYTLTFSNLGANVTGLGFNWGNSVSLGISSVVFSNGDTWTGPATMPNPGFFGFLTDTPFTTATVTLTDDSGGFAMTSFTTQAAAVPEPATLVSSALGGAVLSLLALWRRRAVVA